MLVLSRKNGESIVITFGEVIVTVMVTEIVHRDKVRIGVSAPQSVQVDREEIHEEKQRERDQG